jgi:gamma-glutamyltranspeptidase
MRSLFKNYQPNNQNKNCEISQLDGKISDDTTDTLAADDTTDTLVADDTVLNKWGAYKATSQGLGIVAADTYTGSQVGAAILQAGGNAVDAAVAMALVQGVVSPASSGLGGGAHILYYDAATKTTKFLDSRETAPAASTPGMFEADPTLSRNGGKAVATMSELKGLYQLQREYGVLDWNECTEPAARLAECFEVSPNLAKQLATPGVVQYLNSGNYLELETLFKNADGSIKKEGDTVRNLKLAYTLDQIGKYGPDYLYKTMAPVLAAEVQAAGGILTQDDLYAYTVQEYEPITAQIMGYTLYSASGSSSGGACLAGILEFMEGYAQPMASEGLYNHRLAEAMKHAFAVRTNLADPKFFNTEGPVSALTSETFIANLRDATSDTGVQLVKNYGGTYGMSNSPGYLPDDHGTSHMVVVDRSGNAVSLTSTINTYFGSKVVSPSTGIILNNQMDDFSNGKSVNSFGLFQSGNNRPQSGKRPLSSMSPSIMLDAQSNVLMAIGASGGPRIITATAQVILNTLGKGSELLDAVVSSRIHSQLLPDTLFVEKRQLPDDSNIAVESTTIDDLMKIGHNITLDVDKEACVQAIIVNKDTNLMTAVSDPRKGGRPAGVH